MENSQSALTEVITIIVRLLGMAVLLVGLYVGIKVVFEAWYLYEEPQRIERFAKAIEQGSQLDSLIASFASTSTDDANSSEKIINNPSAEKPKIRLTYFLAWGIVMILLLVISSLASRAIKTGGQLALYDLQVKQLAKQLLKQSPKEKQQDITLPKD